MRALWIITDSDPGYLNAEVNCCYCKPIPNIQHDTGFLPPKAFWQMIMFAVAVAQFLFEVNVTKTKKKISYFTPE